MSISTTPNRATFTGDSSTTGFPFPYWFEKKADIIVLAVSALGVVTTKVLDTDYTIPALSADQTVYSTGATVTMLVAPATGTKLIVYRDPSVQQTFSVSKNATFPSNVIETALDKQTAILQRVKELVTRSFRLADSDTSNFSLIVPTLVAKAILVVNDTNDGFTAGPDVSGLSTLAASVAAAAASASSASTSASTATTQATNSSTSATASAASATAAAASAASLVSTYNALNTRVNVIEGMLITQSTAAIGNNQSGTNVSGFTLSTAQQRHVIDYYVKRITTSPAVTVMESGQICAHYDGTNWTMGRVWSIGNANIDFDISGIQLTYTTDNMAGTYDTTNSKIGWLSRDQG